MDRVGVPFIAAVPDYRIIGENIVVSVEGRDLCAFTIRDFQAGAARSARVIGEHYAKRAEVLPMRKRA